MYNALEIAKVIINLHYERKLMIDVYRLQLLLYLVHKKFYEITGKLLVKNQFLESECGPMVLEVSELFDTGDRECIKKQSAAHVDKFSLCLTQSIIMPQFICKTNQELSSLVME